VLLLLSKEVAMKKTFVLVMVFCLFAGLMLFGCGPKKAATVDEALNSANSLPDVKQKADYLVGQANAFYNSKEFQQAIQLAQYVVNNVDANSQKAKSLIEKAKADLAKAANSAVSNLKQKVSGFGK
jgi:hypothetical protein